MDRREAEAWLLEYDRLGQINRARAKDGREELDLVTASIMVSKLDEEAEGELREKYE